MGFWDDWHQLDHIQTICTSLQTDNHTNTLSLNFLEARCSSWCSTNSVKALKEKQCWHSLNKSNQQHCSTEEGIKWKHTERVIYLLAVH